MYPETKILMAQLIDQLKETQKLMTNQERLDLWASLREGYCDLCGTDNVPCYCDPCFDE